MLYEIVDGRIPWWGWFRITLFRYYVLNVYDRAFCSDAAGERKQVRRKLLYPAGPGYDH